MSTLSLSPSTAHSAGRRLYLLVGLTVAGVFAAYFAVPASMVERDREDKRFEVQQDKLMAALYHLDQLVLATHLETRRGPHATNLGTPGDLLAELAMNHGLAIQAQQNVALGLERTGAFPGAPPIVTRLNRDIEAFLARPDSIPALEQVLLSALQLRRLAVRVGELREETSVQHSPGDQPWVMGLLFVVLAGIVWTVALLIWSSRRTVRALVETIAERDEQAATLRRERDFTARLVDTAPSIILVLDPAGAIQHVNPFFEQLTGWRLDEIRGKDWFATFLPEGDRDRIRTLFQTATHKVPTRGNINAILTRRGEARMIEWNDQTLEDGAGRLTGLLAVGIDVTERQRASEALRASEMRTRQILDGLFGFVGVCTLEGTLIDANDAPLRAAGLRREAVLGRPFWTTYWWNYDPGVQAELQAALAQAARGEVARYEAVVRIQGGALITIDVTFGPLRNAAGEITHILGFGVDITERLRATDALRVSEERLRLALQAAGQSLYDLDLTTGDAVSSPEHAAMIGYDPATFRESLTFWASRLHPDDRAATYSAFEAYVRGEIASYEVEFRQKTRDGAWLWTLSLGSIVARDAAGKPLRMVGTHTNIDHRKRIELKLKEQEAQLHAVVEGAFDGILMADVETRRFTFANGAMCRMLGVTRDELLTMSTTDIHPPESLPELGRQFEAMARGELTLVHDAPLRRKDGRVGHVDISGSVVVLNDRRYNVGVFHDTTERSRAEEAVLASKVRLNEAQRIARVGSWELNLATGQLYWSDEIFRLFEIDQAKFGATYEAFLNAIHPEDRDAVNAAYTGSLRDQKPYRIVHRLRMADGRIKHVEEQCETDFAPDGTPLKSRGTVQDVTERVIAEGFIHRSLREKEMLLREIHHRVKNNLQVVSSLLYFQAKKLVDTQALAVFGEVRERLRAMLLVHEKLYNSRDLAEVDFADYVRSLVQQLAPSPTGASPSVHFKVDAVPLALPIEQAQPCGMVLVELLTNVIKYAFPDGRQGEALVQLTLANGRISLTVGDDGIGLPPNFDAETSGSFGWQLIRTLTTQLGGTTTIEQAAGTRVTVSFPCRVAPPQP